MLLSHESKEVLLALGLLLGMAALVTAAGSYLFTQRDV
jgi:hypothetical protein